MAVRDRRVVVVDGPPLGTAAVEALDALDVGLVETPSRALAALEDGDAVDCLVVPLASAEDATRVLSRIDGTALSVPVVAVAGGDAAERALDAGVAAVVDPSSDGRLQGRLIANRVETVLDAETDPAPYAALRRTVDDELVCVFDGDARHTVAAGRRFGDHLDPADLEGSTVREAFANLPSVATHLDVNYAAALDGETRQRELAIGDRTYLVETAPLQSDDGDPVAGIARFRSATAGDRSDPRDDTRSKVQQLHDVASELEAATTEGEVFDIATEYAGRVLEFDACVISELDGEMLVPRAASATQLDVSPERMDVDQGIAGKTIRTGEPQLVDDVDAADDADPTDDGFGSALSIPVGEEGVFQAISAESDRYGERDLKLAELLIAHVANALERVRYQEALARERDNFAALYQNVPDAAVQYRLDDGEPRIESVNSAFVRLFGYEPDEAVGETTTALLVPDVDVDDAHDLYDAIADGEAVDREVTRATADGLRPFLLRSVPVADERMGYLIYTDLTEQKRRQRELAEKNDRLDRFASVVSHDLRNPLNVASAYLEQARETGDLSLLAEVEQSHDRAFSIIEDVLTLARQGDAVSELVTVDLGTRAREAWESVDTDGATLDVEEGWTLEADPSRLRQLLENLFRNSIEHGGIARQKADAGGQAGESAGDLDLTVSVGSFDDGFYVADDGVGIPETARERLFEHGYTTAEEGTGLGMSIVAEIAEAHGWTVSATESESGGARIEVAVP